MLLVLQGKKSIKTHTDQK